LTLKLEFNPENEALRIVTLRPRGLLTQEFDINNILPWSYRGNKLKNCRYDGYVKMALTKASNFLR